MKIANFDVNKKVLIIAEVGNNHEGNFEVAKRLIVEAARCGVDAVKFQTFQTDYYVSRLDQDRYERLKSFELTRAQFKKLSVLARSLNLFFLSTPLDLFSVDVLKPIVDAFKIASGDINFYPLIEKVAASRKPLIISTGASDYKEVKKTFDFIKQKRGIQNLAFLHCVSSYPTPLDQTNLCSISFLKRRLRCIVGYSDHTAGIEAAPLAVACGAKIIEKHFTLSKTYSQFRDHQLSADPGEMADLVRRIRAVESIVSTEEKKIRPIEETERSKIRRSIAAVRDLPAGYRLTYDDLMWIRPAGGFEPGTEDKLVGRTLKRKVFFGEKIEVSALVPTNSVNNRMNFLTTGNKRIF